MNELEALVILSQIPYLGSVRIKQLISLFGSAVNALQCDIEQIKQIPSFGTKVASYWHQWRQDFSWQEEFALADRHLIKIVSYQCAAYPQSLKQLPDAPLLLYIKGNLKKEDDQAIAVIGTRNATRYGLVAAERITQELVEHNLTIISGLARGIDTVAHTTALKNGRTIAVIGSGLLNIYPKENGRLAEQITENGALISEFSLKRAPEKFNFPLRNRIVSGMSLGCLLIEAPIDSGAMITMQKAFSQKKHLFAIPGPIDYPSFAGNHALIKEGQARLVENGEDIIRRLDPFIANQEKKVLNKVKISLDANEQMFMNCIPPHCVSFDELARLTKLPVMQLNTLLMGLVIKKAINAYPGKIYQKVI